MNTDTTEPKLERFFIFDSTLGQKEGQEQEKLLYYHPKSDIEDKKVRNIGLAEAITKFCSTFNKNEDCEFMHTQKTRQIFLQAEPCIWMVLTVAVGYIKKQKGSSVSIEYQGDLMEDQVLKSHLRNAYDDFRLKHLPFKKAISQCGVEIIRLELEKFYDNYIQNVDFSTGNILSIWSGISFLPLDRQTFLKVHNILSLLQASFATLSHVSFLYKNSFVWCGFDVKDLQAISRHLNSCINSSNSTDNSLSSSSSGSSSVIKNSYFYGTGLTPSEVIYLYNNDGSPLPHHMILYRLNHISISISFPKSDILTPAIYQEVSKLLDDRVVSIEKDIDGQLSMQKNNQSDEFKYIFHNHMNLATKTSIVGATTLPMETMLTITDMHFDLLKTQCSEIVMKTAHNYWIVGRLCNGRESYVIINEKNANLLEVTDQVKRMCNSHFSNLFMID